MLGTTLLSIQAQGQRKTTLQTDIITMTLQSKAPSKIGNETFYGNDGEGAVTFPSMEVLFGRKGTNLRSVGTQVSCRENFFFLYYPLSSQVVVYLYHDTSGRAN